MKPTAAHSGAQQPAPPPGTGQRAPTATWPTSKPPPCAPPSPPAAVRCKSATCAPCPAKGGVWVGANGSGQGWEYIEYGSSTDNTTYYTIGALAAEPSATREGNGNHSAGAPVRFWAPLNTNNGELHFTEEMDQALAATNWTATLAGVLAPRSFIRKNHAIYIRTKTLPGGAWTAFLLGWIEEATIQDDFSKYASWEITVCSIAGILQQQHCPPLRAGDLDLARASKLVKSDQTPDPPLQRTPQRRLHCRRTRPHRQQHDRRR